MILVAGVLFLTRDGHPGPPWVRVAPLAVAPRRRRHRGPAGPAGQVVVVDRRDGDVRAFLAPAGPCPVQAAPGGGFARPCAGHRWDAAGAPARDPGGPRAPPPLRRVPVAFAGGDLYVNPARRLVRTGRRSLARGAG